MIKKLRLPLPNDEGMDTKSTILLLIVQSQNPLTVSAPLHNTMICASSKCCIASGVLAQPQYFPPSLGAAAPEPLYWVSAGCCELSAAAQVQVIYALLVASAPDQLYIQAMCDKCLSMYTFKSDAMRLGAPQVEALLS